MGVWVYNEAAAQIRWDHTMILGGLIFALFSSFPANYLTNSFIIITLDLMVTVMVMTGVDYHLYFGFERHHRH